MKRILTGALALVLFTGAAQAQLKQDTAKVHHRGNRNMMMKQLNLTSDQQAKLKSIHEAEKKDMQSLKENKSLSADQLKSQRHELHKKYQAQTRSVFTPSQQEQLQKMKADKKEGFRKDGQKKDGKHLAKRKLKKQLNLTQDQKDQLAKMRAAIKSQVNSVRSNNSLTEDQKKEKMHSIRKDQREKFQSVLTKEQSEKLQSLKKEREAKITK